MSVNVKSLIPAIATHPGYILKDELDSRKISQSDFSRDINIALTQVNEIIKGKRNITADFAILLEKVLDIKADFWMNLQTAYELDLARIKEKNREKLALVERWNIIKQFVPVKFFKKQNILEGDIAKDEKKIKEIYNAKNIDDIINEASKPCLSHFKKSSALPENIINIVGWVKLVEYNSKEKEVGSFSLKHKEELITEFKKLILKKHLVKNTEKLLSEFGIKFTIQEKPDKAPIDGIAFWSNNNPAIGITLRHSRIDNFVFTVMHELAHVFLHITKTNKVEFVDDLENAKYQLENVFEREANQFAQESLIDPALWEDFLFKNYEIDDTAIIEFANKNKIHPAIIRGRLCHDGHIPYYGKTNISYTIN